MRTSSTTARDSCGAGVCDGWRKCCFRGTARECRIEEERFIQATYLSRKRNIIACRRNAKGFCTVLDDRRKLTEILNKTLRLDRECELSDPSQIEEIFQSLFGILAVQFGGNYRFQNYLIFKLIQSGLQPRCEVAVVFVAVY